MIYRPHTWLLALGLLSGCYLSHTLDGDVPVDAGPIVCTRASIGASVMLEDAEGSGVTPRVVALPGGDVGVFYVAPGVGMPTRVLYERLGPRLERRTGPVTITDASLTWAEPAVRDDGSLVVAYGVAGGAASELLHVTADGHVTGPALPVPLVHPSVLQPSASGLFWLAFDDRSDNAFQIAHVDGAGALVHPPATIALGRYGSGHGAVARPGGASQVLGYAREGPPGARHGYVNAIDERGALGPERLLSTDDDHAVLPVLVGGSLILVRAGGSLVLERTDIGSLAMIERFTHPPIADTPLVAALGDRLLVAHVESADTFTVDDFGTSLATFDRLSAPLPPGVGIGGGGSAVALRGAVVFAIGLTAGSRSFPWLVRVECAP